VGDVARALGKGATYTFEGTAYTLCGWTYGVQEVYERYLEGLVWEGARRRAGSMPEAQADRHLATVGADIDLGLYSHDGERHRQSLSVEDNVKAFVLFQLQESGVAADTSLVARMVKADGKGLREAMERAVADPIVPSADPPAASPPG
jgi:hypothetical protein